MDGTFLLKPEGSVMLGGSDIFGGSVMSGDNPFNSINSSKLFPSFTMSP